MDSIQYTLLPAVRRAIESDNHAARARLRAFLASDPLFVPRFNVPLHVERELALERLRRIAAGGHISVYDFERNPLNIFAAHEVCGMSDGSMATKLTVQWNLFGGTVLKLGSARHRQIVAGVDDMSAMGCFALTELGYGNNAVEMETTARYLPATHEIEVNTPTTVSQKYWITNGALHAKYAVVFAQLEVYGKREGVHAIIVRIRNEDMSTCSGVTIRDMGHKMGCNGVDNATLQFNRVKVPAENLLNKYSDIIVHKSATGSSTSKAEFRSSLPPGRARFLRVADQLLSGRLCIASMSIGGTKTVLLTAFRYSATRLAVGPSGKSNVPILDFRLQQEALIPLLAKTIGYNFGLINSKREWARVSMLKGTPQVHESTRILLLACVIKPLVTWHFERVASVCRERCGGQGYLSCNIFGPAIGFSHAGISAEGDNAVLMQKVAKELLALAATGQYENCVGSALGVQQKSNTSLPSALTRRCLGILQQTEKAKLHALGEKVKRAISRASAASSSKSNRSAIANAQYQVWMHEESALVQSCARVFGERMCVESSLHELINLADSAARGPELEAITIAIELFAVDAVLRVCGAPILAASEIESLRNIRAEKITQLAAKVTPTTSSYAMNLVHSLGVDVNLLTTPISGDWVKFNSRDNQGEVVNKAKL